MSEMTTRTRTIARRRLPIGDGRWISIRPIDRSDAPGLSDFYATLSSESRRRRFLGPSSAALDPELLARFATQGDGLVGILAEPGSDDGAIVAHVTLQSDRRGGAEVAFAVADGLQGRGIGRALMASAIQLARDHGLRTVTAALLAENAPMRRLLLGAGCPIVNDTLDAGVEETTLQIV